MKSLTDNADTTSANFIGTADYSALHFITNGTSAGTITGIGLGPLAKSNNYPGGNAAFGYKALYFDSVGSHNAGFGDYTLYLVSTGNLNTATDVRAHEIQPWVQIIQVAVMHVLTIIF